MAKQHTPATGRDKLAQARAQQAESERNRKLGLVAAGTAVALLLVGGGTYLATRGGDDSGGDKPKAAGAVVENSPVKNTLVWSGLSRNHVTEDVKYPMTPPAGGDHNEAWANCGIYDKEIPNKYAVHSLEHGAVWITYNDKASKKDIASLKSDAGQDYILMSKYQKQDSPIVLTAWEHQIKVKSASDPRVKQFIKAYLQGPQTPEPGASCTGAYDPNTGAIGGVMQK